MTGSPLPLGITLGGDLHSLLRPVCAYGRGPPYLGLLPFSLGNVWAIAKDAQLEPAAEIH